jgi:cell division inhibitor SulA
MSAQQLSSLKSLSASFEPMSVPLQFMPVESIDMKDGAEDNVAEQRIVEFVCPGDARQQLPLILPVLAHLTNSGDQRWLACIGPQLLTKGDCRRYSLNWQRVLQVLPNRRCAVIDMAERALQAGKSHTVCVVAESIDAEDLRRLEHAAAMGNCRGIVIRSR